MKPVRKTRKRQPVEPILEGVFRVKIVEQLCADRIKLQNLIAVCAKYDISLASYV
jgi:hypothetical protein